MKMPARLAGVALAAASAMTLTLGAGAASGAPEQVPTCKSDDLETTLGPSEDAGGVRYAVLTLAPASNTTKCTLRGLLQDVQFSREGRDLPSRGSQEGEGPGETVLVNGKSVARVEIYWGTPDVSTEAPGQLAFRVPDSEGRNTVSWSKPVKNNGISYTNFWQDTQ